MPSLKVQPHNSEAERSVLGAILIDKTSMGLISDKLSPRDFYEPIHSKIFEAMEELHEGAKPIDMLTLTKALKKKKVDIEASFLTDLLGAVPTAANAEYYAEIISQDSIKRSLIGLGTEITQLGFSEERDAQELLDSAESSVFSLTQSKNIGSFVPLKDSLAESFDRIDELHKSGAGLRGVKTGFTDLDNILSGMQASNLLI